MGLSLPVSAKRMDGIGLSGYENESQEDCGNKHLNIQNIKFLRLFLHYLIMKYVFRRAEYTCQDGKYIYDLFTIPVLHFAALKSPFIIFVQHEVELNIYACNIGRI